MITKCLSVTTMHDTELADCICGGRDECLKIPDDWKRPSSEYGNVIATRRQDWSSDNDVEYIAAGLAAMIALS